jgi:thioredoxin reductase (NADPH)
MRVKKSLLSLFSIAYLTAAYPLQQSAAPFPLNQFLSEKTTDFSFLSKYSNLLPVAVIGSGPAGLSAAFVTAKEQFHTVVFQGPMFGGPLNNDTHIGNWPGIQEGWGKDAMNELYQQAKRVGVSFSNHTIDRVDFSTWPYKLWTEEKEEINALSVIIATGASPRHLNIPGEEEYWNKGIETYLYKKDAVRLKGKKIIVVGGGTDAMSKASFLAQQADEVYWIVRGSRLQKERWEKKLKEKALPNLKIFYNSQLKQIRGDGNKITKVIVESPSMCFELPADNVVLAAGIVPNSKIFSSYLKCEEGCYISLVGPGQQCSLEGIFAAGNVVDKHYRQAAISMGDGMKAGYDATGFLSKIQFKSSMCKNFNLYTIYEK